MNAIANLVDFWRQLDIDKGVRVHPSDRAAMQGESSFDTTAMPYPYVGDIQGADVWVLMLNSGIGPDDAKHEAQDYFSERLRRNLVQDFEGEEFPMLSVDPRLSHTGTYAYYNGRNRVEKLINQLAANRGVKEVEARKEISRRVAVVQLFPYRSKDGVPGRLLNNSVKSVALAKAAVKEAMQSKLIVVPRAATSWGFQYGVQSDNLFTFRGDQARSASLMPGGSCGGGDAILSRLAA